MTPSHAPAALLPAPDLRVPAARLSIQAQLGDAYKLYLLEDTEEKPVAVVLPASAVQPPAPPVNEVCCRRIAVSAGVAAGLRLAPAGGAAAQGLGELRYCRGGPSPLLANHTGPHPTSSPAPLPLWLQALLAAGLGAATVLTTLNINGAGLFNFVLLTFGFDAERVAAAVPGTLALLAILGEPGCSFCFLLLLSRAPFLSSLGQVGGGEWRCGALCGMQAGKGGAGRPLQRAAPPQGRSLSPPMPSP